MKPPLRNHILLFWFWNAVNYNWWWSHMHHAPLASIQLHYVPTKKRFFMTEILLLPLPLLFLWLLLEHHEFESLISLIHSLHSHWSRFSLFFKPRNHFTMHLCLSSSALALISSTGWKMKLLTKKCGHSARCSFVSCMCVFGCVFEILHFSFAAIILVLSHQEFQRIFVEAPETRPRWSVRVCLCLCTRTHTSVNKTKWVLLLVLVRWKNIGDQ